MNTTFRALGLFIAGVVLLTAGTSFAQDETTPPDQMVWGSYLTNLGLTAGYRMENTPDPSISTIAPGYAEDRFFEAYNQRKGVQLSQFDLVMEKKQGASGPFDMLYLTAEGLGTAFSDANLHVRGYDAYDFKFDYRRSEYFFNRQDSIFTGDHNWDQTRTMLNSALTIKASDAFDVLLNYSGTGRGGSTQTTISPFVEGADAAPSGVASQSGGYFRGNFYYLDIPRTDWTNDISAQLRYKFAQTNIAIGGGLRSYTEDVVPNLADTTSLNYLPSAGVANSLGIVGTQFISERMLAYTSNENRKHNSTYGTLDVVSVLTPDISFNLQGRYSAGTGTITANDYQLGYMRKTTAALTTSPLRLYRASQARTGFDTLNQLLLSASLRVGIMQGLDWNTSIRYEDQNSMTGYTNDITLDTSTNTLPNFRTAINKDSLLKYETNTSYKVPLTTLRTQLNYSGGPMWNVRAGLQYQVRTPESVYDNDGVIDSTFGANLSKKLTRVTPFASLYVKPIDMIKFRADFEMTSNKSVLENTSTATSLLIRTMPEDQTKLNFSVDVDPMEELSVALGYGMNNGKSTFVIVGTTGATDLKDNSSTLNASIAWRFLHKSMISASFESQKHEIDLPAQFTRGTKVLNPVYGDSMTVDLNQNTTDNVIDLTLTVGEVENLTLSAGFTMVSSTGGSSWTEVSVTGAPDITKVGGPYTSNMIHAGAQYFFTKNIGLGVDWMMASLKEDQTGNYIGLSQFTTNVFRGYLSVRL